jgi:hypothetical protein
MNGNELNWWYVSRNTKLAYVDYGFSEFDQSFLQNSVVYFCGQRVAGEKKQGHRFSEEGS